ncbi:MAG: hypothetical protein HQK66_08980 [Desulfamplus sp.]|nr:hypothetical protein [Desulfamplus sp.]
MLSLREIESAIELLPQKEYTQLREWFTKKDWGVWDKEIIEDSQSGKLDFLIEEALSEKQKGNLKEI